MRERVCVCACVYVPEPSALCWILWQGGVGVMEGINEGKHPISDFKGLTLRMWIEVEF